MAWRQRAEARPPLSDEDDGAEPLLYTVEISDDGCRLDRFLTQHFLDTSRCVLQRWIEAGRVRGPRALKAATKLTVGDQIEVRVPAAAPEPGPVAAEDLPVPILYQDAAILVIDKPAGLTVHPGAGQRQGTLANALLALSDELSSVGGEDRPGIVHRLDKETSGVMVVARSDLAHRRLAAQFEGRSVEKEYLGLIKGAAPEAGTIDRPIGRSPKDRKRMTIREDGRAARTHFQITERFGTIAAKITVRIETGRTHQIRVHMSSLGHGIIGDKTYGRPNSLDELIPRQALHAWHLTLNHPVSGARMSFEAPCPPDILHAIATLRRRTPQRPEGNLSHG